MYIGNIIVDELMGVPVHPPPVTTLHWYFLVPLGLQNGKYDVNSKNTLAKWVVWCVFLKYAEILG